MPEQKHPLEKTVYSNAVKITTPPLLRLGVLYYQNKDNNHRITNLLFTGGLAAAATGPPSSKKDASRFFSNERLSCPLWAAAPSAELLWKLLSTPQDYGGVPLNNPLA
jgi:hypothetical protein